MNGPSDLEATPRLDPAGSAPPEVTGDRAGNALATLCRADALFRERYDGWEVLGRGSFSTVVRTQHRILDGPVALKILFRASPAERQWFVAEARALTRILHPYVVRVFAVFDRDPVAWFEMELVEGVTLDAELRRRTACRERWALEEALEIAACLSEGLAAVHKAGIVHHDVKPGNVLLPRLGQPAAKLADFGIARSVDATIVLSETVPGSPKYMCPEALVPAGRVGPEGDVYALSLTLYELFSGGLYPFALRDGATVAEALDCHRRKAPMALRVLGGGLPDEVVDVIHQGLSKRPRQRPTAAEIGRVMRAAQAGGPIVASPRARSHRLRRLALPVLAVALAVIAVGVAGLALWWLLRP